MSRSREAVIRRVLSSICSIVVLALPLREKSLACHFIKFINALFFSSLISSMPLLSVSVCLLPNLGGGSPLEPAMGWP